MITRFFKKRFPTNGIQMNFNSVGYSFFNGEQGFTISGATPDSHQSIQISLTREEAESVIRSFQDYLTKYPKK